MLWLEAVSPGYLRMMRIPLLAGRYLAESERARRGAGCGHSGVHCQAFLADGERGREAHPYRGQRRLA